MSDAKRVKRLLKLTLIFAPLVRSNGADLQPVGVANSAMMFLNVARASLFFWNRAILKREKSSSHTCLTHFQYAHFIPIVGVGKRGPY